MGTGVVYCSKCGERLLEEDFQKDKAFTILNKFACARCYNAVLANLTPQQRALLEHQPPSHATSTKLRAQTSRLLKKPGTTHRTAPPAPSGTKKSPTVVLIAAGVAAVVGLGLLAALVATGGSGPAAATPDRPANAAPEHADQLRRETARKLVDELKALASQGADPETVANRAQAIREQVVRTPFEEEVSEIQSAFRLLHQRRTNVRTKLQEYLDEAKTISKNYTEFKEHQSVLERFERAASLVKEDLRQREWTIKLTDEATLVQKELASYNEAFARAARRAFDEAIQEADRLIEDRDYTGAVKILTDYPQEFRETEWARRLQDKTQFIRREYLKIGQWMSLFDGKSLNGWERHVVGTGIKDDNWKVVNGVLVGTSSFEKDAPDVTFSDLLYYDADDFGDFELTITCSVEGGDVSNRRGMRLMLRSTISGATTQSPMNVDFLGSQNQRISARVTVADGKFTLEGGASPQVHNIPPQAPARGKIALCLSPGTKVRIESLRIKRLK